MKRHDTYREMRDTWGELLFFAKPNPEDYPGLDEWDMPPNLVAVFRTTGGPAKLICYAQHGADNWYPNTGHRYAIAELIKGLTEGAGLLRSLAEISHYSTSHRDKQEYQETLEKTWPFLDKWEKREPFDKDAYDELMRKKLEEIKKQENG